MVINWGDEQRNREARTGVYTSRKSQIMKPDKGNVMKTIITVRVVFDLKEEADTFVEAISDLDADGMFPTGAEVRRDFDWSKPTLQQLRAQS